MELLRLLTLVYVAVLVLALAVSLTAIWLSLGRTARALAGVRSALSEARDLTVPLESALTPVRDVSAEVAGELSAAEASLREADESLGRLAERLGAAHLVP